MIAKLPLKNIVKKMSHKEIMRILQQAKKTSEPPFTSQAKIQVIGSGMRGVPSSFCIISDHSRYLFNCGESTQRLSQEHHLRLAKLSNIFFTTPSWKNVGGLPGMSLTLQSMGATKVTLHGPKWISILFEAVERFVLLESLTIDEANCSEDQEFNDSVMKIRYAHLKKSTSTVETNDENSTEENDILIDNTNYYKHMLNGNGKRQVESSSSKKNIKRVSMNKVQGCIAYVCKLNPKPGKLDLEKCVEKGVVPGPILQKLKSGQDVTLEDGSLVKSADVMQFPTVGPVFIVIECPDEDYLDSLLENKVLKCYENDAIDPSDRAHCIIHFSPDSVMKNPKYIEWMSRFGSETQHLVINQSSNCLNFVKLHQIQHRLNLLHPTIFPLIHDFIENAPAAKDTTKNNLNIHQLKTLCSYNLRPLTGIEDSSDLSLNRKYDIDEVFAIDGFLDELEVLQMNINAKSKDINDLPAYPKITMLGTGSCIPNKIRNTSAILMQIDEDTSILMDCGEGTVGQLIRFFGPSKIDKILASIKAVYVSHLHADHHLGLLGVLLERKAVTDEPIFLIAPANLDAWLHLYSIKFENIENIFKLIPNELLIHLDRRIDYKLYSELLNKLNLDAICTTEVYHCLHSFGVAWTLKDGKKIVYSGDTMPCKNLTRIGKHCDLLIHEATMEDELKKEAKKKLHSTISEAVQVGKDMNAKITLLTHFSQRYSRIPILPEGKHVLDNVGIAFDNMQFSLSELPLLPLFHPSLRLMFNEHYNFLQCKAEKRKVRKVQLI